MTIPSAIREWQKENPQLTDECRDKDKLFETAQTDLVQRMTEGITPDMLDSEFLLDEFLETWGRRFLHFNALRQVLLVLGAR